MAFTLLVNFEDLCAFVPNRSFVSDPNGKPTECHVLLRKLESEPADWDPNLRFFEHFAHIEFDGRDVDPAGGLGAPNAQDGNLDLHFLAGEHVAIKPKSRTGGGGFSPNVVVPLNPVKPTRTIEENSLWWLVNMSSLNNHARRARRTLLDSPPTPDILAGRFHITEGALFTEGLTEDPWTIGHDVRRIAKRVVLQIDRIDDYVDLELTRFDGSGSRTLRLRPQAGANQVVVNVRNSEKELFFGKSLPSSGMAVGRFDSRVYYAFSGALSVPFSQQRVPVPVAPPAGGHGTCIPLTFSGTA